MTPMKIAITGGTGLVGSHLAEYLAREGYHVRALVRSSIGNESLARTFADLGIEIKEANVLHASELDQAFSGMDVVVHAAGIVDPYASPDTISAVNVAGSHSVLQAADDQGVKQLIFISSLSVITGNCDQYNASEQAPLCSCGEPYADSKLEAEKIVSNFVGKNKMAITILRPGFIYGPREKAWLPQLIKAIASGRAVLIDGGDKETNVIYVENLNRAIEASLFNEQAYGQIYNLTDGQKITKKQLFDAISDGLNLRRVNKVLPGWLVKPIFDVISSVASLLPLENRKKLARFSRAAYRLIGVNQGFAIGKAEKELGYKDRIPFAVGMRRTLNYYKQDTMAACVDQQAKVKVG